jgi:hypothetical protein
MSSSPKASFSFNAMTASERDHLICFEIPGGGGQRLHQEPIDFVVLIARDRGVIDVSGDPLAPEERTSSLSVAVVRTSSDKALAMISSSFCDVQVA